jgi:hypothetical protein
VENVGEIFKGAEADGDLRYSCTLLSSKFPESFSYALRSFPLAFRSRFKGVFCCVI